MRRAFLLLITALVFTGCSAYVKLVKPESQKISPDLIQSYRTESVRISYKVHGGISPQELQESASAFGIKDLLESEKPEQGRITLVIYPLKTKFDKAYSSFGLPWSIVSFATIYLAPLRYERTYPFEIHVLDPAQVDDKKFRIIRTEYAEVIWVWLPLFFMSDDPARSDAGRDAYSRVQLAGRRRMLDDIIVEVLESRRAEPTTAEESAPSSSAQR